MASPRPNKRQRIEKGSSLPPVSHIAKKAPASFLALPPEVRQQILAQTFTPRRPLSRAELQTLAFESMLASLPVRDRHHDYRNDFIREQPRKSDRINLVLCLEDKVRCLEWVATLMDVHDDIRDDVRYVKTGWLNKIEEYLEKQRRDLELSSRPSRRR
ncbi:hypothetical protein E6O75_ATG05737 [Venturia nashicola]|uniref:Uncharacterized protein n=1 Tax=Venturia nashicola TaxID=86259 RepID=A0A4Z1PG83_9PEZI|nr:hypothetical protein E6O75_ATG05737 [Venturia nashicola]